MSSRTRSRRPASIGSNQSSRRWTAVPASDCRARDFVLLLLMAWSPPARKRRHRLGFNHPETTPPAIPTTPRTAPSALAAARPALSRKAHKSAGIILPPCGCCQPSVQFRPSPPPRDVAHSNRDCLLLADQHDQLLPSGHASVE